MVHAGGQGGPAAGAPEPGLGPLHRRAEPAVPRAVRRAARAARRRPLLRRQSGSPAARARAESAAARPPGRLRHHGRRARRPLLRQARRQETAAPPPGGVRTGAAAAAVLAPDRRRRAAAAGRRGSRGATANSPGAHAGVSESDRAAGGLHGRRPLRAAVGAARDLGIGGERGDEFRAADHRIGQGGVCRGSRPPGVERLGRLPP